MKKILLVGALALFGAMNAQSGFKIGAHVGLPVGDISDTTSFNFGVDAAYTWRVADNFDLGITTGYSHYTGKDYTNPSSGTQTVKGESTGMIPVAATAQYGFNGGFFVGADLGYAFFTEENSDGGFYYQPKIGYTLNQKHDLYLGYKGISLDGGTVSSVNLGYAYKF